MFWITPQLLFKFKIKEASHIQKDQTFWNQQLHHVNLKPDALRALTRASYRSTKSSFTSSSKGIEYHKHKELKNQNIFR